MKLSGSIDNLIEMNSDSKAEGASKVSSLGTFSPISKSDTSFSFSNASLQPESDKVGSLFHSFIDAHTKLLKEIDESDWDDIHKLQEKVKVLESYTRQLAEQNEVLVKSVEELEREAEHRAIQLESRLKKSAKTTKEAVLRLHEYEREMRNLLRDNVRKGAALEDILSQLTSLKVENSFLRDQNANLRHDIKALLHIIHQARSTGHWELECVTFCEVTPEQVFGPVHPLSQGISRDSLGWQDLSVPYQNGNQGVGQYSISERSSCLTSHHSSFSNLPDADISPSGRFSERDVVCSRLEGELRHLQQWREEAQMELLEKDKLITALEAQITTLNHEIMVKQAECDYHVIDISLLKQQARAEQRRESDGGGPLLTAQEHHSLFRDARSYPCGIDCVGLLAENYMFPKCLQDAAVQVNLQPSTHRSCQTDRPSAQAKKAAHKTSHLSSKADNETAVKISEMVERESYVCDACDQNYEGAASPRRSCTRTKNPRRSLSDDAFQRWKHSDICLVMHNADNDGCDFDRNINVSDYAQSLEQIYMFDRDIDVSDIKASASAQSLEKLCVCDGFTCNSSKRDAQLLQERDVFPPNVDCITDMPSNYTQASFTKELKDESSQTGIFSSAEMQTESVSKVDKQLQTEAEIVSIETSMQSEATARNTTKMADFEHLESLQKLREHVRKAEDKATSKEMLVSQLQKHLENAVKEVTLKDTALENAERKLGASREECSRLNNVVSSLESDIERLKQDIQDLESVKINLRKNVEAREEQIQEIKNREEIHQEQKRLLMVQLDDQGEKLIQVQDEASVLRRQLDIKIKEVEGQAETIRYLQEALVQTKMALEEARVHNFHTKKFASNSHPAVNNTLSRSQIMDI